MILIVIKFSVKRNKDESGISGANFRSELIFTTSRKWQAANNWFFKSNIVMKNRSDT